MTQDAAATTLLGREVVERSLLDGHDGRSGARLERVRLADGRVLVVKTSDPSTDLTVLMSGVQHEPLLWASGALDRLPPGLGHPILDIWDDGACTVTVMRDLGDAVPGWSRVITADECLRILDALTAMHATFLGRAPDGLCPLETRLTLLSPQSVDRAPADQPLAVLVKTGWEHFADQVAADVTEAVSAIHAEPAPLAVAMRQSPTTLLHADLWPVNLALEEDRLVVLDWRLRPTDRRPWTSPSS